jgi:carboxypeptidase Q
MTASKSSLLAGIALAAPLLVVFSFSAQAQESQGAQAPAAAPQVLRLGGQLMLAGRAYDYDRALADDIGPRLTGSANYDKAVDYAVAEFQRLGLSNVHRDPWEIDATWEPEVWATASIVAPHQQRLHLEADGWSPSTPEGGIRGNVIYLPKISENVIKSNAAKIKGAIVLVDDDTNHASEPLPYGKEFDDVQLIAKEGAQAIMLGVGAVNNASTMYGLTCCRGALALLPVASVGLEDTLLLRRLLDRGPVEVEFSFTNRVREHVKVNNVVAEIPGTDSNGEYIVIAGHLDSWHLGTGAEDNGTGAASVLAVAEAMKAAGIQPRRTVRFILFGGEEQGLLGSNAYVREHVADMDKCAGVFVTDTGSEPPKGWYVFGRDDEKQSLAVIKPLLSSLGAADTTDDAQYIFDTDNGAFTIHGVPSYVLWTGTDKYLDLHHKPSDTFDKVNQRDLNLGAAVVGVTALAIADAPSTLPHYSASQLENQLKQIKAWDDYQDAVTHHMF